jgi:predicted metal-dependent HD superfamily phosphohydrolase
MVESAETLNAARFSRLWRGLGAKHDGAEVLGLLRAQYASAARAYHTQEHICECLGWFDAVESSAERALEVEAAIWFHDAVYEIAAGDNEAKSAELAQRCALDAGIAEAVAQRIAGLIMCTTHAAHADGPDARLLVDIDLSILGAAPDRYQRFERDIRREYAAIPEELYRSGRLHVLNGFLERIAIYETPYFAERLERQARANLAAATAALR